jgi:metal-responsive CopG/Arc/MetJ family transcriptional regulator
MKTAISVPDDLFRQAEEAARRLGVSRSELYAKAIAEFLRQRDEDAITERLNAIYSRRAAKVDSRLRRAQLKSLERSSWEA